MDNLNKGKIRYLAYLVFSGIMALNQILRFIPNMNLPDVTIYRVAFMMTFVIIASGLFGQFRVSATELIFLLCGLYFFLINFTNGIGMVDSLVGICWALAFVFGERVSDWECTNYFVKTQRLLFFLIVVSCVYAMHINFIDIDQARTNIIAVNYTIYYGMPILLIACDKYVDKAKSNKYSDIALFALWVGLSIFSFKRTTLIAVVVGIIVYLYRKYFTDKKAKNKFVFLFAIVLLYAIARLVISYTDGYIIERFYIAEETGGNGRVEIWKRVTELYSQSNVAEKLLGNGGINSVDKAIGVSAHNDFLEILYDYGICGVLILLIVITLLCRVLFHRYVRRSRYAPLVLSSVLMFCIFSTFSHVVLYPYVSIPVFFFLGNLYSSCRRTIELSKVDNQNGWRY